MKKTMTMSLAICMIALAMTSAASANTTFTHYAIPSQIPDAQQPLISVGAPTKFGSDSWQKSATGAVNWYACYGSGGNYLSVLSLVEAASMTIDDIASFSYLTKRPDGAVLYMDWAMYIYKRLGTASANDASWYKHRFNSDYTTHTETKNWTKYSDNSTDFTASTNSTDFKRNSGTTTGYMDFAALRSSPYKDELVEMNSVQTLSNWTSFSGPKDGPTINLNSGNIEIVNFASFAPVPESATITSLSRCVRTIRSHLGIGFRESCGGQSRQIAWRVRLYCSSAPFPG